MKSSASALSQSLEDLLEEFAGRLRAGEELDAETFARERPEHAHMLRLLLPTIQALADLGRSAAAGEASAPLRDVAGGESGPVRGPPVEDCAAASGPVRPRNSRMTAASVWPSMNCMA